MTAPNPPAIDPGLVARVQNILMRPKLEWPVIDAEYATTRSLFARYAMILAAIGPVASLIERDNDIPAFAVLLAEAKHADGLLRAATRFEVEVTA